MMKLVFCTAFSVSLLTAANAPLPDRAAARFLDQSTWGSTPAAISRVQQQGFAGTCKHFLANSNRGYAASEDMSDAIHCSTACEKTFATSSWNLGSSRIALNRGSKRIHTIQCDLSSTALRSHKSAASLCPRPASIRAIP